MQRVTLSYAIHGDTWAGIDPITVNVNGATPAAAAVSARMQFRKAARPSVLGDTLTTADGSIVIVSASLWLFRVPPRLLTLVAGVWTWDFQITDANGTILTPFGGVIQVVPDVTQ
jgi:hypothetical protein